MANDLVQDSSSPHAIRDELTNMVIKDLLGPAGGPEEELSQWEDRVRERYLVGMLAPKATRVQAEEMAPRRAIKYMVETWPGDFTTESAAHSKINRAKARGMLEGSGRSLQLTDKAIALLEGTPS